MNLGPLGKQVGPLPLGVWLLVGGGGLFIAYRKSTAPAPVVDPNAAQVDPLPAGGGSATSPQSWDGAPVVMSPVIQNAPPSYLGADTGPVMYADPITAPVAIPVPPASPRVPSPVGDPTFAARHAAYLKSPAGIAAAKVYAKAAADKAYSAAHSPKNDPTYYLRHAAYLKTPAGIAATKRNAAKK